ncbi:DNA methyltransferase [Vibrio phage LV6]|nr:DNA methyltransferase [Vibrio phage LV6]
MANPTRSLTFKEYKNLMEAVKLPKVADSELGLQGHADVELSSGMVLKDFPIGKFDVVYLDPPWQYSDTLNNGKRGASHKYNTMSLEELAEMPIMDLLHANSIVCMWITTPFMSDAMLLARYWGLEQVTRGFLWVKRNKRNNLPFKGLGHWTRGNPEDCYIFRPKGSKFKPSYVPDELVQDRLREHSQKPEMVRNRINTICGSEKEHRIELFSRTDAEGWEHWGDGVGLEKA